jgi:hypothetical protein
VLVATGEKSSAIPNTIPGAWITGVLGGDKAKGGGSTGAGSEGRLAEGGFAGRAAKLISGSSRTSVAGRGAGPSTDTEGGLRSRLPPSRLAQHNPGKEIKKKNTHKSVRRCSVPREWGQQRSEHRRREEQARQEGLPPRRNPWTRARCCQLCSSSLLCPCRLGHPRRSHTSETVNKSS